MKQLRQRIPTDLREKAVGQVLVIPLGNDEATVRITPQMETVQVSLRTRDPVEAKARHVVAMAYLNGVWASLREKPDKLSHKQVVALAGEEYRELVSRHEDNPGTPEGWEALREIENRMTGSGLQIRQGVAKPEPPSRLARLLARYNLAVDEGSKARLRKELVRAASEAMSRLERNANGDYSPDANLERFPELQVDTKVRPNDASEATFSSLLESWWCEAKAGGGSPRTYQAYRTAMRHFANFLGHEDARKVEPKDVVRFKDDRVKAGLSLKTIKDNDLAGIRRILGHAVANFIIPSNPAKGVTVKVGKGVTRTRSHGFTDEEAIAVLRHARDHKQGREGRKIYAAKRWVPWLCAYTGARVGEMAQLRKEDVIEEDGYRMLHVTPDAGTVKTKAERDVPIHSHLVDLGFLEFVDKAPKGHLFLDPRKDGDVLKPLGTVKNRVRDFVRQAVPNKDVQPTHGWRHRFKTIGRNLQISEYMLNELNGHAQTEEAAKYGDYSPEAKSAAIEKFPRYDVS